MLVYSPIEITNPLNIILAVFCDTFWDFCMILVDIGILGK